MTWTAQRTYLAFGYALGVTKATRKLPRILYRDIRCFSWCLPYSFVNDSYNFQITHVQNVEERPLD